MAKGIARIGREKTARTLAERLFDVSGADRQKKLRIAEKALVRANPNLKAKEGFSAGGVVVVPDIGLPPKETVERPAADLDGALREAAGRLQQVSAAARQAFAQSAEETRNALALLKDEKVLKQLTTEAPEARELAAEARKSLTKRDAEDKDRQAAFDSAVRDAVKEIDALRRLARGRD